MALTSIFLIFLELEIMSFNSIKSGAFRYFSKDDREVVRRIAKEWRDFTYGNDESLTARMAVGCKGLPANDYVNLIGAVIYDGSPEVVYRFACEFVAGAIMAVNDGTYE